MSRHERYLDLFNPAEFADIKIGIIGTGAVGRQVALQLASMTDCKLGLIDPDTVDEVNLGPQGYRPEDIGHNKTEVTQADCQDLRDSKTAKHVKAQVRKFQKSKDGAAFDIIALCVDNIATRKFIWDALVAAGKTQFLVDGRVTTGIVQVLVGNPSAPEEYGYDNFFFREGDTVGMSCTARTTLYAANICAGLMVSRIVAHLRGFPICNEAVSLSLLDDTLEPMEAAEFEDSEEALVVEEK